MVSIHEKYEVQNLLQEVSEHDPFTLERYQQFSKLLPKAARTVLDVGCNTGRGGSHLKAIWPAIEIFGLVQQGGSLHTIPIRPHPPAPSPCLGEGEPDQSPSTHLGEGFRVRADWYTNLRYRALDCSQKRIDVLPEAYSQGRYGLSTEIPVEDRYFDVIVAGEFLEHLYPIDVDKALCEFQRVLKIGGRLLLTTPNPNYLKNEISKESIYCESHLTQHFSNVLRFRLLMHGFSRVKIFGSGKVFRYLGANFPIKAVYGSYLVSADKY